MPNQPHAQDPQDALLLRIADKITPLFQGDESDPAFARNAAMAALAAYHPESPADFVNIARILAFSMAALTALGLAVADDLTPAQKMRYFGRANALNRSVDQSERMMMQRRRDQRAHPPAELPAHLLPTSTAEEALPTDADIDAAVEEAMAAFRTTLSPQYPPEPPIPTMQSQPAAPPQPAIHHTSASHAQPRPRLSYKQSLLQNSAMYRVVNAGPLPPIREGKQDEGAALDPRHAERAFAQRDRPLGTTY